MFGVVVCNLIILFFVFNVNAINLTMIQSKINEIEVSDSGEDDNNYNQCSVGEILAINKITSESKKILLKINVPKYFGNIKILLHKCLKKKTSVIDNYMLIQIIEEKIDEDASIIFQGWISSDNIAVSTFEHPIYEVFANGCLCE